MHFPGFTFGWTLGFLEVLGVTFFSYWERKWAGEGGVRRASLRAYLATTLCLLGSSSLSNKVRREGGRRGGREGGWLSTSRNQNIPHICVPSFLPPSLPPFPPPGLGLHQLPDEGGLSFLQAHPYHGHRRVRTSLPPSFLPSLSPALISLSLSLTPVHASNGG